MNTSKYHSVTKRNRKLRKKRKIFPQSTRMDTGEIARTLLPPELAFSEPCGKDRCQLGVYRYSGLAKMRRLGRENFYLGCMQKVLLTRIPFGVTIFVRFWTAPKGGSDVAKTSQESVVLAVFITIYWHFVAALLCLLPTDCSRFSVYVLVSDLMDFSCSHSQWHYFFD